MNKSSEALIARPKRQVTERDALLEVSLVVASVVVAICLTVVLAELIARAVSGGTVIRVATFVGVWPVVAYGIIYGAGRIVWGRPPAQGDPVSTFHLLVGCCAAAVSAIGLILWSQARYGSWDPDYTGISSLLPFATSILALTAAYRPASRLAAISLAASAIVAAGIVVLAVAVNVPGALDGLAASSALLAVALAAPALYVVVEVFLAARNKIARSRG